MRRRVVVTGIGCVTPVGNDVDQMWASLRRCGNGVGPITHFPADDFPTQFSAEVKDYSIDDYVDDPDQFTFASPNILFAIGAASQAMNTAGPTRLVAMTDAFEDRLQACSTPRAPT